MTESLTKTLKKKKGFTLIELIIVVAIIAILAALAIPKLLGTQDNARKKTDVANAKMIYDDIVKLRTEDKLTGTDWGFKLDGSASGTTNAKAVQDELQTNPIPSYKNSATPKKNFYVNIDTTNNTITITLDAPSGDQIYPNPSGIYQ